MELLQRNVHPANHNKMKNKLDTTKGSLKSNAIENRKQIRQDPPGIIHPQVRFQDNDDIVNVKRKDHTKVMEPSPLLSLVQSLSSMGTYYNGTNDASSRNDLPSLTTTTSSTTVTTILDQYFSNLSSSSLACSVTSKGYSPSPQRSSQSNTGCCNTYKQQEEKQDCSLQSPKQQYGKQKVMTSSDAKTCSRNKTVGVATTTIKTRDFSMPSRKGMDHNKIVGLSFPSQDQDDDSSSPLSCCAKTTKNNDPVKDVDDDSSGKLSNDSIRDKSSISEEQKQRGNCLLQRASSLKFSFNDLRRQPRKSTGKENELAKSTHSLSSSSRSMRTDSSKSTTVFGRRSSNNSNRTSGSLSGNDNMSDASTLGILLIAPKQNKFEIVNLCSSPDFNFNTSTVGDTIALARQNAIEKTLSDQKYKSVCNTQQELAALMLPIRFLLPSSFLQQSSPMKKSCNNSSASLWKRNQLKKKNSCTTTKEDCDDPSIGNPLQYRRRAVLLVAVPVGYTATEMQLMKTNFLKDLQKSHGNKESKKSND